MTEMITGPIRMHVLLITGEHVSLYNDTVEWADGKTSKINELPTHVLNDLIAIGAAVHEPKVPAGYTAEELERDNPYNQWMYD